MNNSYEVMIDKAIEAHRPLQATPIGETWRGDKVTNTEAQRLLCELRAWVDQFQHPEAVSLRRSIKDLEKLFSVVWTEIDESLTLLSLAQRVGATDPARAEDYRLTAMGYLHRWQDRGGRMGNAVMQEKTAEQAPKSPAQVEVSR